LGLNFDLSALYRAIRLVDHLAAFTIRTYRFLIAYMEVDEKSSAGTGLLTRYYEAMIKFT
jgi:hypothetical protein